MEKTARGGVGPLHDVVEEFGGGGVVGGGGEVGLVREGTVGGAVWRFGGGEEYVTVEEGAVGTLEAVGVEENGGGVVMEVGRLGGYVGEVGKVGEVGVVPRLVQTGGASACAWECGRWGQLWWSRLS